MSQQFCLKLNNHLANLQSVFKSFQASAILVDVTLSCEGHNIKAHKVVLSACSPYFESLFTENPCQHPIVIINGMKFEVIKAILDFIYKGEVNVSHDGLPAFLRAAETLQVKGLAEVCGENSAPTTTHDVNQQADTATPQPQRTGTPTKKRNRARKRSLSDSNKSDEEGVMRKREPMSPEIHELSGDECFTGDMKSNDGSNLNSHVPMNAYSLSHQQSASNVNRDPDSDEDYELESSKLLEQTISTNNQLSNNQVNTGLSTSSDSLRIEKKLRGTPDTESSNMQGPPESPPDIKPIIQFEDSSGAGPPEGTIMLYNEHSLSQPGPSNYPDNAQHEGGQSHDFSGYEEVRESVPVEILPFLKQRPELTIFETKSASRSTMHYHCDLCPFETNSSGAFHSHTESHKTFKGHECPQCGKAFKNPSGLQTHMRCHEPGQFTCMYCEKKFKHNSSLRTHVKSHFNFDISCPMCEKTFNSNASMKKHLALHHQMDNFHK